MATQKNTDYRLMQVERINAECSKGSILQYFRPSLSYNLSLRSGFIFVYRIETGFTVSSCRHMRICLHVGRPLLIMNLNS